MSDETAFLNALRTNPADDTTRLVYADWLDERGDPAAAARAEFLRLEAEWPAARMARRKAIWDRLRELAAGLDTGWLAAVSKLSIENCAAGGTAVGQQPLCTVAFEYQCPQRWERLEATDDPAVRFCRACEENVYYCDTMMAARVHVEEGRCVAVDQGIPRTSGDLDPPATLLGHALLGRVRPDYFREREARRKPDPVSEARERRKRGEVG